MAHEKVLADVYARYQLRLTEAQALDFDDLIMTAVRLLHELSGRRRALSAPVPPRLGRRVPGHQPRSVRAGARTERPAEDLPPGELAVVGDADQAIYAFRGASIRNILEFERDYPNATTILLEQNYRSTQTILTAANSVIARNPDRKPKNLWSEAGAGEPIAGYVAENEHDEAAWVGSASRNCPTPASPSRRTSPCSIGRTRSPECSRKSSSASACRTR